MLLFDVADASLRFDIIGMFLLNVGALDGHRDTSIRSKN